LASDFEDLLRLVIRGEGAENAREIWNLPTIGMTAHHDQFAVRMLWRK
jgi:hypothetical protein